MRAYLHGRGRTYRFVGDEVAILSEDVGAHLDDVLVAGRVAKMVEDLLSRVLVRE